MGDLKSYTPTIRDQLAWLLSDFAGDNRPLRNYINDRTRMGADMIPGLGTAVNAEEAKRSFDAGDYKGAALSAIFAMPGTGSFVPEKSLVKKGIGSAEKSYLKGVSLDSVPEWVEAYHGTKKSAKFDVPEPDRVRGIQGDSGLHVTSDPSVAAEYTGFAGVPTGNMPSVGGGRTYPVYVDPGKILEGMPDLIQWNDPVTASYNAKNFLKDNPDASDEVKGILQQVLEGKSARDAVVERGYDSVKYRPHSPDFTDNPGDAYALFGNRSVVPKFSEEGVTISKSGRVRPASKELVDKFDTLGYMADRLRGIK